MNKEKYDVVYRRIGGVGVAVIRRNEEDILAWLPQQNFSGEDEIPISRQQCPEVWKIVDSLELSNFRRKPNRGKGSIYTLLMLSKKEIGNTARLYALHYGKIPEGFSALTKNEENLLLLWIYEFLKYEHSIGLKSRLAFLHEDSVVSEVFNCFRWDPEGNEYEVWGGYKRGKEIIKSLCLKAGLKEFIK